MTTQIAALAGAVVALFAWLGVPKLRGILRIIPAAALVLAVVMMFTRVDLPPFALTTLIGAGAVVSVLTLIRG